MLEYLQNFLGNVKDLFGSVKNPFVTAPTDPVGQTTPPFIPKTTDDNMTMMDKLTQNPLFMSGLNMIANANSGKGTFANIGGGFATGIDSATKLKRQTRQDKLDERKVDVTESHYKGTEANWEKQREFERWRAAKDFGYKGDLLQFQRDELAQKGALTREGYDIDRSKMNQQNQQWNQDYGLRQQGQQYQQYSDSYKLGQQDQNILNHKDQNALERQKTEELIRQGKLTHQPMTIDVNGKTYEADSAQVLPYKSHVEGARVGGNYNLQVYSHPDGRSVSVDPRNRQEMEWALQNGFGPKYKDDYEVNMGILSRAAQDPVWLATYNTPEKQAEWLRQNRQAVGAASDSVRRPANGQAPPPQQAPTQAPQMDQRVAGRVQQLKQAGWDDARIANELRGAGIDPTPYGYR